MAKSSALTWILREAKRLRKKYPRRYRQWKDYVAQASAIYAKKHKGKSAVGKPKRKTKAGKVIKQVERVSVERTVTGKKRRSRKKSKSKPRPRKQKPVSRRRTVSGKDNSFKLLALAAIAVGGYLLLSKKNVPASTTPYYGQYGTLQTTTNVTRNTQSQDMVNYAIAAGYAADAITKLISSLNTSSDAQIKDAYDYVNTTGDISAYV